MDVYHNTCYYISRLHLEVHVFNAIADSWCFTGRMQLHVCQGMQLQVSPLTTTLWCSFRGKGRCMSTTRHATARVAPDNNCMSTTRRQLGDVFVRTKRSCMSATGHTIASVASIVTACLQRDRNSVIFLSRGGEKLHVLH